MCHSSFKTLRLIRFLHLNPDQELPDMSGTHLPRQSSHSDHCHHPNALLHETPAFSVQKFQGLGSVPLSLLLNHSKISPIFMKLPKCYESKEILEFGMRLPNHWNAWKIFVQMRCKDLEQEAQKHTQVHKGTDRKPPGDDRGGRRKGFCHSFLCRQIFSHW